MNQLVFPLFFMIFHRDPVYPLESIIGQRGEFDVAAWLEMEITLTSH
jgi:hypothetical protein